jgi:hypothetical protein
MPEMIVCPVSSSVRTRNEGSSVASFCSERPSFSWSALLFGSIAIEMTGSGNSIDSKMIGFSSSHSVSPVAVVLRPTGRGDVAGVDLFDLLALARVHLEQPADALAAHLWSSCICWSRS